MSEIKAASETEVPLPPRIVWDPDDKEMILIPGGEFTLGRDDGQENEAPRHSFYLEPFYIDRYPVTQSEYHSFVQATGHPIPYYELEWLETDEYNWDPDSHTPPSDKLDHPVVMVSWKDAQAYSTWAQKRLPTEAEWERTARGHDGRRWPWGNEFKREYSNTQGLGIGRTTAVYRFSPCGNSPEGVSDLIGNVWEWTSSLYMPYPYDDQDGREDLAAKAWRVLRGGSWRNDLTRANSTARLDGDFLFYTNVGFRCAVSARLVIAALECDAEP